MKKLFLFLLLTSFFACDDSGDDSPTIEDNFDRQAMLINWADNIIIPAYTSFGEKTAQLKDASDNFVVDPSLINYEILVSKWELAYTVFQDVSMFEIGKAEELRFTNNLNIYPTDVDGLLDNALNGGYHLELPDQIATQGFPALDYLLFGIANDQETILDFYQNDENASKYLAYLSELVHRINDLTLAILTDWNDEYRSEFIENSGNSALSSVDKTVNDFIFYYEKHLRAGKIGIPAGVFSNDPLSGNVEALYRKNFSKILFNRSLDAVQNFFNGVHYGGSLQTASMTDYIDYLKVEKDGESLAKIINDQFETARTTADQLMDDFKAQIESDNVKMLATYDQLQVNVTNIKLDMLQAFNISADYIDADGD